VFASAYNLQIEQSEKAPVASKYYPLRQWQSRSDVREVHKALEAAGESITMRVAEQSALGAVTKRLQAGGANLRNDPLALAAVDQEARGTLVWGEWALAGKRILHFTPELTQAFVNSDSSDMRISDVAPEYRAQYFRFDMPEDSPILLSGGNVVFEGAYVLFAAGESMRICLTGRPISPMPLNMQWRERYDLLIRAEHFGKPAQDAIDLALADDIAFANKQAEAGSARGMGAMVALSCNALIERQREDHGAFKQALQLVLNACAYLQIEAEDNLKRWSDGAPAKLLRQVEDGSPKEVERAHSKLWSLGHVPIFHIGEEFGRKYRAPDAGVRAHWRKGHFRRQPHGPQMSLRKLIWLRPMLVSSANLDGDAPPPPQSPSLDSPGR
jgi:hypothetical protein